MNHSDLKDKCRKAFGDKIPFQARESWALFVREERTEYKFRYDWIKDPRFYRWIEANKDKIDICDGNEWLGVYICHQNGEPINNY